MCGIWPSIPTVFIHSTWQKLLENSCVRETDEWREWNTDTHSITEREREGEREREIYNPTLFIISLQPVPAGSPSRDGNVTVYVYDVSQPSLPAPFNSVLVSVSVLMTFSTVISLHKFSRQLSVFSSQFFRSYLCLIGPFNNMSLYERLLQPWYSPSWLTGLKTAIN